MIAANYGEIMEASCEIDVIVSAIPHICGETGVDRIDTNGDKNIDWVH
jgi:hypothetical protein